MSDEYDAWGQFDWGGTDWPPTYRFLEFLDPGTVKTLVDDLEEGQQYSFRIRSEPGNGERGEWAEVSLAARIAAAENLEVSAEDETTVALLWDDVSDHDGVYEIVRRRADLEYDDDGGRVVATLPADAEDHVDDTAAPGKEYEYAVRARTDWRFDDSEPVTTETDGIGLETRSVPSSGWYVEIDHPDRSAPLKPELLDDPQKQPTVNGYPRVSFSVPADERWLDTALDDAPVRVWKDGQKQPVDRLEHRTLTPETVELEARGGTQLDRRVVESADIEEALVYAEYLIEEYTDYIPVVDDPDDVVRKDVLLLAAAILAELQGAFEAIPDDVPLEYDNDGLQATNVSDVDWDFGNEDNDDVPGGAGALVISPGTGGTGGRSVSIDHAIPDGDALVAVYSVEDSGSGPSTTVDVEFNGTVVEGGDDTPLGSDPGWDVFEIEGDVAAGSHDIRVDPGDFDASVGQIIGAVAIVDARFTDLDEDELVNEPGGHLERPFRYPERDTPAHLALEEIATPLSIVRLMLEAVSDDGEPLPELSIGVDGSDDDFDTVTDALSHDLEYDDLAAVANVRVGLGHREDLEPRDATPRLGYEPQALDELELRADLDETPVVVNYQRDARLEDHLQDIVADIADAAYEIRPGDDGMEVHIARIDSRETDVDPDLINYSIERNTEDTVDRAIVYAGAESIRRLPIEWSAGWQDLPLPDGQIVRESETVYDADDDDEEALERGEDYEIRPLIEDGPPQIKFNTFVSAPRLDCDFQPRGEHERSDLPDEPREISEHATNLSSQQMADIAAFQAVEGSYTDAVITARITVPPDEIGWNVIDALNVPQLPGGPYQVLDEETDPRQGQFPLGVGRGGKEEIQRLDDRTGNIEEQV
ncbi:fibronectin type III domain-containing protein [Natrarchaeobaculum sulfurireducens]|uniref:Fibronectin type-III domain-containing protein n=1 Tax=Natrarchaeobaculum sulfurireducens TaxID=2044521 RepID=A0A346PMN6_9EURY|nr:fibronectin type III domain-containing protein [Natrarchaeobaculum sulfurireducens]AXR80781.1 hypothetical protein AArcMg_0759 [Natrarchaeobaculum sulfurireducens]